MADKKVLFLDTTLRDGEQSAGIGMTGDEKFEIAKQLQRMKVDIIEAGFAASSPGDFEAVTRIAKEITGPIICSLARAHPNDVDQAWQAIQHAEKQRIHVFLSSSDIHVMHQLRKDREEVMGMAVSMVDRAKGYCSDVEFSPMDATRTVPEYLYRMLEEVIEAGATTVNIADTVGYAIPSDFTRLIKEIKANVRGIDNVNLSVHCHNDLGLAVANSLGAIANGARQVECTINGIGERAGNASMEEIVMALNVRSNYWDYYTNIKTEEIYNTSRMVSGFTGMLVQPNKAIVGENAFAHESGIHQDGMLKNRDTYEIMTPESVGIMNNKIVLGRHSGRHGLSVRFKALGYEVAEEEMGHLYERFLELADKKKEIYDEDLRVLMGDEAESDQGFYNLDYLHVNLGTTTIATATVRINSEGKTFEESATGDGPVDACFRAINRAIDFQSQTKLEHYQVRSVTAGKGALGEVTVRLKINGSAYTGKGISTDTIRASAKSYLQALNHYEAMKDMNEIFETISETV